eukprot:Blabericola_migrator_1__10684@NODE_609_length_7298_cov_332_353616_g442_i0_p2_GENE_NODE_609_length_7298_cov_332_353616_g442_i0NODE_609_length_7298_cov_332_353616_g442_i0_p2_ORF_typecomplete_len425_score37_58zfCCCH/PF00642_24/3_3e08zfCCCH/PF00642_24/0_0022zfCCCH_3/PF15663_5/3_1e10zf_CCCH_4/PF18345_1/4_9e08zf_CCCH_4/PF18345_1/4_9e02Torus/PF16131_5/0_049Torus/PF16131_5/0_13zfCCCH_4/PF18044_1/2_4e05zfCCCH_4/PF18044_1/1_1e03zfCCCH_2/PF14608_6/0_0041zfCCCH_2/PF14608_6/3_7e02_NODE_609_length_7298_cov_33
MRSSMDLSASTAPARTAQRLQCFKTKRCRFWLENRCSRGDKCTYAHTDVELRCPPDLTKTKICTRWKRGVCDKSPESCAYAHGIDDLRAGGEASPELSPSSGETSSIDASPVDGSPRNNNSEPSTPSPSESTPSKGVKGRKGMPSDDNKASPTQPSPRKNRVLRHDVSMTATTVASNSSTLSQSSCSLTSSASDLQSCPSSKNSVSGKDHKLESVSSRPAESTQPRIPKLVLSQQRASPPESNSIRELTESPQSTNHSPINYPSPVEYSLDFTNNRFDASCKDTMRSVESMASTAFPPLTPGGTYRSFASCTSDGYMGTSPSHPSPYIAKPAMQFVRDDSFSEFSAEDEYSQGRYVPSRTFCYDQGSHFMPAEGSADQMEGLFEEPCAAFAYSVPPKILQDRVENGYRYHAFCVMAALTTPYYD